MAKYRIMIVDDEEDIHTIVRHVLIKKYEVVDATDGLDALEKLEKYEPDFIIMDVMMPLMDGFRTCQAIRRHPVFESIPVLFLSALNTREDMKKGYSSGGNLFLTKPFDPQRLLKNVDVFFETTPPPLRKKKYTVEDLAKIDEEGLAARTEAAEGSAVRTPEDTLEDFSGDDGDGSPPIAPTMRQRGQDAATAAQGVRARPRLMVVDDDADIVQLIKSALATTFEVVTAHDGIDAIERIVTYEPDIILIDALMPRMSGYQLCQSLRRNRRFCQIPIIFMSAKSNPKDVAYARRIGGTDFIPKPFEMDDLRQRLGGVATAPDFKVLSKRLDIAEIYRREEAAQREQAKRERERTMKKGILGAAGKEEGELERFIREMGSSERVFED